MLNTVDTWADFLFPVQCSHCDTWDQGWLCPSCRQELLVMSPLTPNDLRCFQRVSALTQYKGPVKDVLHRSKYEDQPWRLVRFTQAIVEMLDEKEWFTKFDVIVPMAGDPWRTWKRGFNPARLIAKEIARKANVPLVSSKLFTRSGSRPQQTLSMDERSRRYESQTFTLSTNELDKHHFRKCLLVDDIATTGATLMAAARVFEDHGIEVQPLVLSIGL